MADSVIMEPTHEEAFVKLCQRSFRDGDTMAGAVLLGVERNDFALGLQAQPLPDTLMGQFKMALVDIGVPQGTQHLPEDHVSRMRALKNEQRALFHTHNTERQHQLVAEILRDCNLSQPSAPGPLLCSVSRDDHTGSVISAARFMSAHVGNVGAHSFIHGLRVTLEQQLATPASCIIWRIPETTLSQAGGETFVHDAVKLLTALHFFVLEFKSHQDPMAIEQGAQKQANAGDADHEDGWIDWQAHPQWSDRSIEAVLRCAFSQRALCPRAI